MNYKEYNFCARCTKWIRKGDICPDHPNQKLRTKRQQSKVLEFARY